MLDSRFRGNDRKATLRCAKVITPSLCWRTVAIALSTSAPILSFRVLSFPRLVIPAFAGMTGRRRSLLWRLSRHPLGALLGELALDLGYIVGAHLADRLHLA